MNNAKQFSDPSIVITYLLAPPLCTMFGWSLNYELKTRKYMTMKSIYLLGLMVLLLTSCGTQYEYWDISKFKIDHHALEDKEEIKLLYFSQGPDANLELTYYYHLIAVSQKTGDTVNILTTANNGFKQEDGNKTFIFFNEDNAGTKMLQASPEEIKNIGIVDLDKIELKRIEKVARDPKFDHIANNQYPTIIGAIGTFTPNGF